MKHRLLLLFIIGLTACENSKNQEHTTFQVVSGDSIARVTTRLINEDIITQKQLFRIYAKITGKDSQLKIGTYKIPPNASYSQILDILSSGVGEGISVTIPEGFNIFQIAYILEESNIVSAVDFLNEVHKNDWLQKFNISTNSAFQITTTKTIQDKNNFTFIVPTKSPDYSLEGYLFPDTYSFEENSSASTVVSTMTKRFNEMVDSEILAQIKSQNKNLHDIIILASIIQKEAVNKDEMPQVSGVYNNRLDINMILQADPTLIYGLLVDGEYDGNIRSRHLRPPYPSPYNTYYVTTLPIGPIANPGRESIVASLNPTSHKYLYFVGNSKGGHTYSRTLAEHNKAVQEWVKYLRGR